MCVAVMPLPPNDNEWALPAGFIRMKESLEEGAKTEFEEDDPIPVVRTVARSLRNLIFVQEFGLYERLSLI